MRTELPVYFFFKQRSRGSRHHKDSGFHIAVKRVDWVFQFAAPERHHPMGTLETVQLGVSNVARGLLGPEIS
jgi:hypothetical protein